MENLSFLEFRSLTKGFGFSYRPVYSLSQRRLLGFTLLELVVVIAIVGILAGIAIPGYFSFIEKAKVTKAISELSILEKEILIYELITDPCP